MCVCGGGLPCCRMLPAGSGSRMTGGRCLPPEQVFPFNCSFSIRQVHQIQFISKAHCHLYCHFQHFNRIQIHMESSQVASGVSSVSGVSGVVDLVGLGGHLRCGWQLERHAPASGATAGLNFFAPTCISFLFHLMSLQVGLDANLTAVNQSGAPSMAVGMGRCACQRHLWAAAHLIGLNWP